MAIFKKGPLVSDISGTLGGINFVNSKGSPVMRRLIRQVNKRTTRQVNHRIKIRQIIRAWRGLSEPDKRSWITTAQTVPRPNRLGIPRFYSGYQLYLTYMLQHFDTVSSLNIPALEMKIATNGWTWTFTLNHTGSWLGVPKSIGSTATSLSKFFLSRSNTSFSRRVYHNYNFFLLTGAALPSTIIRQTTNTDPLLYDGQVGEKISFKVIATEVDTNGMFLDSPPSFFEATIIA